MADTGTKVRLHLLTKQESSLRGEGPAVIKSGRSLDVRSGVDVVLPKVLDGKVVVAYATKQNNPKGIDWSQMKWSLRERIHTFVGLAREADPEVAETCVPTNHPTTLCWGVCPRVCFGLCFQCWRAAGSPSHCGWGTPAFYRALPAGFLILTRT